MSYANADHQYDAYNGSLQDISDLKNQLEDFKKYLKNQKWTSSAYFERRFDAFSRHLWASILGMTPDGAPLPRFFMTGYSSFHVPYSDGRRQRVANIASAAQDYFGNPKHRGLNRFEWDMQDRIKSEVDYFPSSRALRKGYVSDIEDKLVFRRTGSGRVPHVKQANVAVLNPHIFRPALRQSAISSFVASAGTTMLLGGVSRLAIMASLGFVGAPVMAATIGGGIAAGMITGAYSNYRRNREEIGRMVANETTFWGRMKARLRGIRKSYTKTQFATNVATSALGVVGGGMLGDFLAEKGFFSYVADRMPGRDTLVSLRDDFVNVAGQGLSHARDYAGNALDSVAAFVSPQAQDVTGATIAEPAGAIVPEQAVATADGSRFEMPPVRPVESVTITPDAIPADAAASTISGEPLDPEKFEQRINAAFDGVTPAFVRETGQGLENTFYPSLNGGADLAARLQFADVSHTPANFPLIFPAEGDVPVPAAELAETPAVAAENTVAGIVVDGRHTVRSGDTLWKLTRTELGLPVGDGDARHEAIRKIVAANPQYPELARNPGALKPGWVLNMPDLSQTTVEADCRIVRGQVRRCTLG